MLDFGALEISQILSKIFEIFPGTFKDFLRLKILFKTLRLGEFSKTLDISQILKIWEDLGRF